MKEVDAILVKVAELIKTGRFEELETDALEIKPVPPSKGEWRERHKSINAFLNTRGGTLILGINEEGQGSSRHYVLSGWKPHAEPNLKEFPTRFTDREGRPLDLSDRFSPMELLDVAGGRVAVIYVDELPADQKFVYLDGVAFKRSLTGDHKVSEREILAQEEFKAEAAVARELQPVPGLTLADLDLAKLNQFIFQLNQPVAVETIKPDLADAVPFLTRKNFLKDNAVTVLGALVCAKYPGDRLHFRCHVHGYVDLPTQTGSSGDSRVVQDKQDFVDNVLQLMDSSLGYLLRNIQVGVAASEGGVSQPQYPETLLRETINNALAHRDYSIDRQVILAIKPGKYIEIRNPGTFRPQLLVEAPDDAVPVFRIIPEAKPRNPKLADVLRVFRKWEGRGIGMATMVNLCLQNRMDLPYYRLHTQEVSLFLCGGKLLDDAMERLFQSFDGYIESALKGNAPTQEQKLILSYLIKSERANERLHYTIMLTSDNNHFSAIKDLHRAGLIEKHPGGTANYPIYIASRTLMSRAYVDELRVKFGPSFDAIDPFLKQLLGVVFRFQNFSKAHVVSAKQASFSLWYESETGGSIEQFDAFYRKVRRAFNRLEQEGLVIKQQGTKGYVLNSEYLSTHLL